jgi:hypothetical protein
MIRNSFQSELTLVCTIDAVIISFRSTESNWHTNATDCVHNMTCIAIARQRLGKHVSAGVNARKSRTSIARKRRGKHASSTTQAVFSAWSVPRCYERTLSPCGSEYHQWMTSLLKTPT